MSLIRSYCHIRRIAYISGGIGLVCMIAAKLNEPPPDLLFKTAFGLIMLSALLFFVNYVIWFMIRFRKKGR